MSVNNNNNTSTVKQPSKFYPNESSSDGGRYQRVSGGNAANTQQQQNDISIQDLSLDDIKTFENGIKSTNMLEAKVVSGVEKKFVFKILEVMVHDQLTAENVPAYSIGQYEVFSDSHTKWTTYNINALYYVRRGNPLFWIGDEGQTIKSGNYIVVPAGVKHCMYNKSDSINVKVDIIFPGKINVPSNKKN